jgi:hypothetical protein
MGLPERRSRSLRTAVRCIHANQARHERTKPVRFIVTEFASSTHKVKVWTNEELIATRTPADLYIFQKEEQAAALEMEGFNNVASCFAFGQPAGNAEETQKEIDATFQSIRDGEEAVNQSRKALSTGPEDLKLRNQLELAQRVSELNHAREHLWTLQEHLREMERPPVEPAAASQ